MDFLNNLFTNPVQVDVNVKMDEKSTALLGLSIFAGLFLALLLAGLILKKIS